MRRGILNILFLFSALGLSSCIENDLSYPHLDAAFSSFEVDGQKSVSINADSCTVEIVLDENADMSAVRVTGYAVSNGGEVVGGMPEYLNLNEPVRLTLKVYEDFVWTVSAVQPIERYIRCDNQIGEAEIDPVKKTAYVYVTEEQSLLEVKINEMKLEPEGSRIMSTTGFVSENGQSVPKVEECNFPMTLDCVIMRYFTVDYAGEEIEWSVKFLQKKVDVSVSSVNAWACSAGVRGVTDGKGVPVFEYRIADEEEWRTCSDVKISGTVAAAHVTGLEPDTEYVVRLTNGITTSQERGFRTGAAVQLPNLNFDSWSDNGKYPNAEGSRVWDSANSSGAAVTTSPSDDAVSGKAARLESVSAFGMLAAGNIFTGSFAGLAGLGAELDWGSPFSSRPLALKGYFKYTPMVIGKAKDPYKDMLGKTDECQILVFLTDWTEPFRVNTNEKKFVDLDNDTGIIALGQFNTSETVSDYVSFTLPLTYRNNTRIPRYIVIAGAASHYGDYFTGGIGSVLYLDEFELVYEPSELTDEEYDEVFSLVEPV